MKELWPWFGLFFLGAYHGINPGMGWLFAVALGLQQKTRRAVLMAFLPLTLGHAISIGLIVGLLAVGEATLTHLKVRILAAVILVGFGIYRAFRSQHPRWVGMRVGFRDLTLWSFLMASAHGAGLMLAPIILSMPHGGPAHPMGHFALMQPSGGLTGPGFWLVPVGIHTLGYLFTAMLTGLIVYEKAGLAILRRAWLNLDTLWAFALIATGVLTVVV